MKFENFWALINISGCHITKSPKLGEPRILPNLNDRRQRRLKSNHHHYCILKSWSFKLQVLIRIIMPQKTKFDTYLVFLSAFKSISKRNIMFVFIITGEKKLRSTNPETTKDQLFISNCFELPSDWPSQ